jgi:bifunctional UDP-N-acetylglucosamine pyrophosphorylase/glucosamine-1-phosphate N-acetyltransferase
MRAIKATALILAAGKGVRMKSALPKVMHELAGKPLLSYVVKAVREAGIHDIVVVVGAGRERIMDAFKDEGVRFAHQREQLGTAHAAQAGCSLLETSKGLVAILAGDVPLITPRTIRRAFAHHREEQAACTVITALLDDPTGYGRVVKGPDGAVLRIVEEKDASADEKNVKEVNSSNYIFALESLQEALPQVGRANKQQEYYLTDCVEILHGAGKKVSSLCVDNAQEILGINSKKELAAVERIYRRRIMKGRRSEIE